MTRRKVYVILGSGSYAVRTMFEQRGWDLVNEIYEADLIVFTGGADVSPAIYGEHIHPTTHNDVARDEREQEKYDLALSLGIPMAGICRGGQFLNVMNKGSLYQDVDNHAINGTHAALVLSDGSSVEVSSTHHQMMRPNLEASAGCTLLLTANIAKKREHMSDMINSSYVRVDYGYGGNVKGDTEAVHYSSTNCLCFQPHPELIGPAYLPCRNLFFDFINKYLFDVKAVGDKTLVDRPLQGA